MSNAKSQIPLFDSHEMIEVRPGERVAPLPESAIPRLAIATWTPAGDGTFRPVAKVEGRAIRLTPEVVASLKLPVSYTTIKRLIVAGFVAGGKVTPSSWVFDPESYIQHQNNVFDDEEFWDEGHPDKNLERWKEATVLERG